jgi:Ca-activated chloride channel homolog
MYREWLRIGDHGISFTAPEWLPLAAGAAILLIAAVVTAVRRRRAYREGRIVATEGVRLWIATALRAVAYLSAVAALAGIAIVETQREDRLTVVALRDESASISPNERRWMNDWFGQLVDSMWPDDQFALLAFGREPRLVAGPGNPDFEGVPELADVDGSATNLMSAIESAAGLASGSGGAVVLLSDGNQTMGDAVAAAESARRRGVRIYPVAPPRKQAPLTIEHVSAPELTREGRDVKLSVAIANRGTEVHEAVLVARQGDVILGRVPLRVEPGHSVVEADVRAGAPGHYTLNVELEAPPEIASPRAGRSASLSVLAKPRILFVSPSEELKALLEDAGFAVDRVGQLQAKSADDLARYHAVVLGAVERQDLSPASVAALEQYVRDRGGGLLLAAGRAVLADAKTRGSALERILPVRAVEQKPKKKVRQPLAMFLVVDRSSSMSYGIRLDEPKPTRISYAREAALALIAQLRDSDLVGAIAFDTETSLLSSLQPLSQSRSNLNDLISRLMPSGGTDFKEGLEIAARQLVASGARIKHILLLTDGASIRPAREHEPLIEDLARSGITVTSIRIGDDKDSFELIREISGRTNGGFHHVVDAVSLPNLMIEDARQRAGRRDEEPEEEPADVEDVPFQPRVVRSVEALGGLATADLPQLQAFAAVPVKPGAEVWLDADRGGKRSPILAAWQNGLGRVAVFTANPTYEWQSWGQVRRFWSQIIRWLARPQSADELRLALRREAEGTVLAIDSYDGRGDEMVLRVTDREGQVREIRPTALGARHHEAVLPALDTIEPRVEISVRRDGKELFLHEEWLPALSTVAQAGAEDPEAEPDRALLQQIAEITGGAVDADLATILRRAPAERQIVSPLGSWFAMAALGFLVLDLCLRLVRSSLLG